MVYNVMLSDEQITDLQNKKSVKISTPLKVNSEIKNGDAITIEMKGKGKWITRVENFSPAPNDDFNGGIELSLLDQPLIRISGEGIRTHLPPVINSVTEPYLSIKAIVENLKEFKDDLVRNHPGVSNIVINKIEISKHRNDGSYEKDGDSILFIEIKSP